MTIKVSVFKMIDFLTLGDESHTSISGGVATHDYYQIDEFPVVNVREVLNEIKQRYNVTPYIFDDRLEHQLTESESLSFYIEEVIINKFDNYKLKEIFPMLEEG